MNKKWFLILIFISKSLASIPFFLTSILRSGTYLLSRCLELLTELKIYYSRKLPSYEVFTDLTARSYFICSHLPYDPIYEHFFKEHKIPVFFIIRDPHEVVLFARGIFKYFEHEMTFFEQLITYLLTVGKRIFFFCLCFDETHVVA